MMLKSERNPARSLPEGDTQQLGLIASELAVVYRFPSERRKNLLPSPYNF